MEAPETIAFLAASAPRACVLASLYRDGPLDRGELAERCDAARVTVGRNLRKLRERGLVRQSDGEGEASYRLTPLGELLADGFLALVETVELAGDLAPVLRRLPPEAFDLNPRSLAGADVTEATSADPYAPVMRHARSLETASRVRQVTRALEPQLFEAAADRIVAGDLRMEVVVSADAAAALRTTYAEQLERMLATDRFDVHVYRGEVPFFLAVLDDVVQIGVEAPTGGPRALAETAATPVREWARSTYRSFRAGATPFEAP